MISCDLMFNGIANTSSTPIRWEGGGGRIATKWQTKATSSLKSAKWHPLMSFHLHILHKAVKSMAKLIRQLCGKLHPAFCLPR